MHQHPKFRIAPMAAAVAAAFTTIPVASAQEEAAATLEEIIVTARKRSESVMVIPASVQALSGEDLKDMGARGMADYSRFIPSLNVITEATGDSVVVFRGANVDSGGYVAQSTSSVYLDEISLSNTGEQPGIRMVDIARVEALAGPQGALYGSDAQAGTLRVITNKPVINELDIVTDLSARSNDGGEDSYDGSLVVNLPLVEDRLALRLVGFTAKDGGFIDNIFGHTPDTDTGGADLPSGFGTLDNSHAVEKNWNDGEIDGYRAALLWDINENWTATFMAVNQEVSTGAPNAYDPFAGDLKTVKFDDEFRDDEYDMYSFNLEADLGFAQLVAATSYFDRSITSHYDNTAYHHEWAASYCVATDYVYYWTYESPNGTPVYNPVYCNAPTLDGDYLSAYDLFKDQDRFTQEFRLSSQGETVDWLVGYFYEDSSFDYTYDFAYPTANENTPYSGLGNSVYQDSVSLDYYQQYYGETFPNAKEHWYEQSETRWEQNAVFGEVVWHATDRLDITAGGRYFERDNYVEYFEAKPSTTTFEQDAGILKNKAEEKEFLPKLAVSYTLDNNAMIYGLWTQGQRPGGTNRGRGEPSLPQIYDPDKMSNYEAGYKSTFADGAARMSLTVFKMEWEDYQLEIVDPSYVACPEGGKIAGVCGQPWQNVVANGGDSGILGASIELDWAISNRFVVGVNAEWLDAETESDLDTSGDGVANITSGSQLPISADLTGAAWASYNWPVSFVNGSGYARLQWSYTGETLSNIEASPIADDNANPQFTNDSFNIGDFSIGLRNDTWEASVFVNNLTDERAQYNHDWGVNFWTKASVQDGRERTDSIYTNRPRELGIRLIYRWGDN